MTDRRRDGGGGPGDAVAFLAPIVGVLMVSRLIGGGWTLGGIFVGVPIGAAAVVGRRGGRKRIDAIGDRYRTRLGLRCHGC